MNTNKDMSEVKTELLINTTIGHELEAFVHSCVANILFVLLRASAQGPGKPRPTDDIHRECQECRYMNASITHAGQTF